MVKKHHENLDICGLQNFEKFSAREKSKTNLIFNLGSPPPPIYDFRSLPPSTSHRSISRRGNFF
jgi:hypothetical protein